VSPAEAQAALAAAEQRLAAAEAARDAARNDLHATLRSRGWRPLIVTAEHGQLWEHAARSGRTFDTAEAIAAEQGAATP